MNYFITQFATAEHAPKADLFQSLGIDWKLLALQTVAFLLLLVILRKWVYPPLVAMLDKRDADMQASAKAAKDARDAADAAEVKTEEMLKKARKEAAQIVASARDEAAELVDAAHKKAADKADALVKSAQDEIAKEVESAKKALHNETLELVTSATGTILRKKVDAKTDEALISQAIKEAR